MTFLGGKEEQRKGGDFFQWFCVIVYLCVRREEQRLFLGRGGCRHINERGLGRKVRARVNLSGQI